MQNIEFDRKRFKEAFDYYAKFGLAPQTGQLRFEIPFEKGRGIYNILVNSENNVKRATEQYLKRNDLFITKSIFVGLMVEKTGKEGHAPVLTYPMLQSDALPAGYLGLKNSDGEALYNGTLSIMTGQTANYQGIPLRKFRHVPKLQPGDKYAIPAYNPDEVSFNLPEKFSFAGTQDQKVTVSFPHTPDTDIDGDEGTAVLVVIVDGWLVEGGTNERFKESANPYGNAI